MALPLTNIFSKYTPFVFDESYVVAFEKLQSFLVSAPIMQPLDFSLPFEIICNASDFSIRSVLGQAFNRIAHVIYYTSRTLIDAQRNYSTTRKSC